MVYYKRKSNLIYNELDDELVIIDPSNGYVHLLNTTGKRIFELLECPMNISELTSHIASNFIEVTNEDELLRDIIEYIEELLNCGLINREDL